MKKIILITACLFTLSTVANAQTSTTPGTKSGKVEKQSLTPEMRAQKTVDKLNSNVILTEVQKPKVYALALDRAKKVDEIRLKYNGKPELKVQQKNEISAVKKEYHKSVKAILAPEQVLKMKQAPETK